MIPYDAPEAAARDYVARYVAELSPEKRAEMEKRNAEFLESACCDEYQCGCDAL